MNGYNYPYYLTHYIGTIFGYTGSTAQEYAEKYYCKFESLGEYTPEMKMFYSIKALIGFLKKTSSFNTKRFGSLDINDDGKLNVFDLIIMKRRLAKLYN